MGLKGRGVACKKGAGLIGEGPGKMGGGVICGQGGAGGGAMGGAKGRQGGLKGAGPQGG